MSTDESAEPLCAAKAASALGRAEVASVGGTSERLSQRYMREAVGLLVDTFGPVAIVAAVADYQAGRYTLPADLQASARRAQ